MKKQIVVYGLLSIFAFVLLGAKTVWCGNSLLDEAIQCSDTYWTNEEILDDKNETVCILHKKKLTIAFKPDCLPGGMCIATDTASIHKSFGFKVCSPSVKIFSYLRNDSIHFVSLKSGKEIANIKGNPLTLFCDDQFAFIIPNGTLGRMKIEKTNWKGQLNATYIQTDDRHNFNPPFYLQLVNDDTLRLKDGIGSIMLVKGKK